MIKIMEDSRVKDLPKNVVIKPYIADMPSILPEIAAIVGRAGATSLAGDHCARDPNDLDP